MAGSLNEFVPIVRTTTATTNSGSVSSTGVDLGGTQLQAIVTPSSLDGTSFTFYASADGSTYNVMTNQQGTTISATVAASRYVSMDPTVNWRGARWVKLVSNSTESAARSITLVVTP